jgi:hypothetical protein
LPIHSGELIHKFSDEGEGHRVVCGPGVEFAIILYWSKVAILLFDVEEGECIWGLGWSNVSFSEVLVDELLECNVFYRCEWVDFAVQGLWGVRFEINGMIPGM